MALLLRAKRAQLLAQVGAPVPDDVVKGLIETKELLRHCRRRTAGPVTTAKRIDQLLKEFEKATDTLGTPLLKEGIVTIWVEERPSLSAGSGRPRHLHQDHLWELRAHRRLRSYGAHAYRVVI